MAPLSLFSRELNERECTGRRILKLDGRQGRIERGSADRPRFSAIAGEDFHERAFFHGRA
jgi:hypothetical protein